MLRYIIGISVLAVLIMTIRKLSDGKILKKHQYALWLLIPLYMIVSPFLKIDLPILEAPAVPAVTSQTEVVSENGTGNLDVEPIQPNNNDQEQMVYPETNKNTNVENRAVENKTHLNIVDLLTIISLSVSAVLILAFMVYNIGFILYCRHKRYFIRQDQTCGLKIYAIKYKSTPFLLLNKIYVDEKSDGNNEYIICHEACHYKHGDPFWIVLRYIVLALNWYNPLVWAAFFQSGIDCELACDEEAIRLLGREYSSEYAKSLFEILRQQSEVAFGFTVSAGMRSEFKTMKKRIASIKTPSKKSYKALALCMAILVAFSGCTLINPTTAIPENNTNKIAVSSDATLPDSGILNQSYPASDTSVIVNDTIPDDYIRDGVHADGGYGGRVYKDQLILRSNGKQYLAVGQYADVNDLYVYYSDEDLSRLNVGDEFVYDRDIRFTIESLEVTDWDYPFNNPQYPQRPKGKILLNKDYCLIHGNYERDDNENIIDDSKSNMWLLTTEELINWQAIGIRPVEKIELFEYSDKCIFTYHKNGSKSIDGDHELSVDDLSLLFSQLVPSDRDYCSCSFTVRKNKIVEVSFYVDYY